MGQTEPGLAALCNVGVGWWWWLYGGEEKLGCGGRLVMWGYGIVIRNLRCMMHERGAIGSRLDGSVAQLVGEL